MRFRVLRLAFAFVVLLCAPIKSAAQPRPSCQQPLATLTATRFSYTQVEGDAFDHRVYVYVPQIKVGPGPGFEPFRVWVVEGVYAKPFIQAAGSLDESGFEQLRRSPNVRASPVAVAHGGGLDWGRFTLGKNIYQVQILSVNAAKGAVQMRVCR